MFSGLQQTYRRHGFLKTIPYVVGRLAKRLMICDVSHLMVQDATKISQPTASPNPGLECRFITADELREFAKNPKCDIDPEIIARIETGYDFCFGGILDGVLVSYCWLALHSIEKEHNKDADSPRAGIAIAYPDTYAFRYKGYTHPDYRGRRMYQYVGSQACLAMQELGVRYILSTAEIINYSALKSSYRSGYEFLGILAVIDFRGFRYLKTPDLSKNGIHFDSNADVLDRGLISSGYRDAFSGEAPDDQKDQAVANCSV